MRPHKRPFALFISALLTSLVAFAATSSVQTQLVPDYKGQTLQQVQSSAYIPNTQRPLFKSITAQGPTGGTVVSQNPAPNTPVVPGATALLLTLETPKPSKLQTFLDQLVAKAEQQKNVRVPQLSGDTKTVASRLLEIAHLTPYFLGDPNGVVSQQSPIAGTSVKPGSTITVTLAVPGVTVPYLYGQTLAEATARLQQSYLRAGDITGNTGTVTAQSVAAGTQVPRNTSIALTLTPPTPPQTPTQTVPPPVPEAPKILVPALARMTSPEATSALLSAGLQARPKGPANGFVSAQSPAPGTEVASGTAVTFTLHAPTVVVPNLLQDTPVDAVSELRGFKLHPRVSFSLDPGSKTAQVVTKQSPDAGTSVDEDTTVDLTIGNLPAPKSPIPGWLWILPGVLIGGLLTWRLKRPSANPLPPSATCTLTSDHPASTITLADPHGPALRFTITFRDEVAGPLYQIDEHVAVTRKR